MESRVYYKRLCLLFSRDIFLLYRYSFNSVWIQVGFSLEPLKDWIVRMLDVIFDFITIDKV